MRLAVVGTFHGRYENTFPLLHRLLIDGTRKPDELWLMCEDEADVTAVQKALFDLRELDLLHGRPECLRVIQLPTPRSPNGRYQVIPYSYKINYALEHSEADLFVYLDNGSMPGPDKYRVMAEALEEHPDWGGVYVTQQRTGFQPMIAPADVVCEDGFCALNYTQVMHRRTPERWTLDMVHANPDMADGLFWRQLHPLLGPFWPVGGETVHDTHHMESATAVGIAG